MGRNRATRDWPRRSVEEEKPVYLAAFGQPLWLVLQRQGELIHEAQQYRLARACTELPADHRAVGAFMDIGQSVGRRFAGVRRTLSDYDAPCNEPCPDCAPC